MMEVAEMEAGDFPEDVIAEDEASDFDNEDFDDLIGDYAVADEEFFEDEERTQDTVSDDFNEE